MKLKQIIAVLGFACFLETGAHATLDYLYLGPGYADCSGQIDVAYPTDYSGGLGYNSGMWVGQWVLQDTATKQTFTAFCLSPAGGLYPFPAAYNPITAEDAKYGMNPSTWSKTGGIENAVYIWSQNNTKLTNNTEGAALNLAIWAALYNSTAVGSATPVGRFYPTGTGFTSDMQTLYASYISNLNAAGASGVESVYNQHTETILRPVNPILQELIDDPPASPGNPDPPPADPPPTSPDPGGNSSGSSLAPEPSSFFVLLALLATTGGKWLGGLRGHKRKSLL